MRAITETPDETNQEARGVCCGVVVQNNSCLCIHGSGRSDRGVSEKLSEGGFQAQKGCHVPEKKSLLILHSGSDLHLLLSISFSFPGKRREEIHFSVQMHLRP